MQNNAITSIPPFVFSTFTVLKIVDLHANDITWAPPGAFVGLRSLTTLALENNSLTSIDSLLCANHPKLTELTLNDNVLTEVPESLLSLSSAGRSVVLQKLALQNNLIVGFAPSLLQAMAQCSQVFTSPNPIVCDHAPSVNTIQCTGCILGSVLVRACIHFRISDHAVDHIQ